MDEYEVTVVVVTTYTKRVQTDGHDSALDEVCGAILGGQVDPAAHLVTTERGMKVERIISDTHTHKVGAPDPAALP